MKLRTILIMAGVLIALCVVFMFVRQKPDLLSVEEPPIFIWDFEMVELYKVDIALPKQQLREVWVKHEDHYFYFDGPDESKVDMSRWGGGVPLLLSGPTAVRKITDQVTDTQLSEFGLDEPSMLIGLTLDNGEKLHIELGDNTQNGQGYYIKKADSNSVFIVDYTWYDVFEKLVLDPPYPEAEKE